MSDKNPNVIRCIVIHIMDDNKAECDGTVHEFDTDREYRAFADGVREGASVCGGRCNVYTKDVFGKLPPIGNTFVEKFLINVKETANE